MNYHDHPRARKKIFLRKPFPAGTKAFSAESVLTEAQKKSSPSGPMFENPSSVDIKRPLPCLAPPRYRAQAVLGLDIAAPFGSASFLQTLE